MDLPAPLAGVLNDVGRMAAQAGTPMVAVIFGNPYAATALPDVAAITLTYDWTPLAEQSAVAALGGMAPITGRLPITLSPYWPIRYGLTR